MSEWQPIKTAPKDGSRILITDGVRFTAAKWHITYHSERMLVFDTPGHLIPARWEPNPLVGQVDIEYWRQDNPVAFMERDEVFPDYNGNFDEIVPTLWSPMIEPPK